MNKKLTGVILAGGKSSRMGQDKGLMLYRDIPLVKYSIDLFEKLCTDIIISTNNPEYSKFGYPLIADEYADAGPIGGLYSSLNASEYDDTIVSPCDMPFLTSALFQEVLSKKGDAKAAVIQSSGGRTFPTVGYFHKEALDTIQSQIQKKQFKMLILLEVLNARIIQSDNIEQLANFNAPEDLL
nr:molybdenum cofactor guanylyltransferase [uncultured Carboxylicivirga sp.]